MSDRSPIQNIAESAAFSKYQSYAREIWIAITDKHPQFNGDTKIERYATYRPMIYLAAMTKVERIQQYDERNPNHGKWWRIAGELLGKKDWIDKGYRKTILPTIPTPNRREIPMERFIVGGRFYTISFAGAYDAVSDTFFVYVP